MKSQEDKYSRTLEEYLRSLWSVINQNKDAEVSCELIFNILQIAFVTLPQEFNEQWLSYDDSLNWSYQNGEYVIEGWDREKSKPIVVQRGISDFKILTHTILFQIADLHRMRGKELNYEWKYYGITSPTGNSWYNFDVFTYLACGTAGFNQEAKLEDCDWVFLASILELGRLYE